MSEDGNKKGRGWIMAIVMVLIAILIAWQVWRMSGGPPAVPTFQAPSPGAPQSSPTVSEARPALPLETAKKPFTIPPISVKVPKNQVVAKKIPPATAPAQPTPAAGSAGSIPAAIIPPPAPPPPVPLEWQGNDTAITHPGEVAIRNDRQWVKFWSEHHPHEAAPDVDFSRDMVIGVFAGPRPADQFTIRIVGVRTLPGRVTVDYREKLPPPGTFAVDVTVYPFHLRVVPQTTWPVKFNKLAVIDTNR